MDIKILPLTLSGTVQTVPSKSQAHRALICAALADKQTVIEFGAVPADFAISKDITVTVDCLNALGADIRRTANGFAVTPIADSAAKNGSSSRTIKCRAGESGSTFRFLLPLAGALGLNAEFFLEGRLSERPISPLSLQMVNHGCELSPQGSNPFFSRGKLQAGNYTLDAGVSSQFISGLLFALPILDGNSALRLSGEIESAPYVDLTAEMLQRFGIEIDFDGNVFRVRGNQTYKSPQKIRVEGDWSNAAFWLCAGAISENPITCTGLDLQSKQGDRAVLEILENFGASVERGSYSVTVCGGDLHATEIDARNIPDLVPILSVAAAAAKPNGNIGSTVIRNAARLRIKESDRLAAVADVLNTLGANVVERRDGLEIRGGTPLNGGIVSSWNDHRIAMSAAIAAALLPKGSENPVVITNAEAVNKSYPGFFEDLDKLKHSERHGY